MPETIVLLDMTTPERADRLRALLPPGFVLTHAVIGLLRAATIEADLALDPQRLEDELVRLMEAYIAALIVSQNARR